MALFDTKALTLEVGFANIKEEARILLKIRKLISCYFDEAKECLGFRIEDDLWAGPSDTGIQFLDTTPYRDKSPGGQVSVWNSVCWASFYVYDKAMYEARLTWGCEMR